MRLSPTSQKEVVLTALAEVAPGYLTVSELGAATRIGTKVLGVVCGRLRVAGLVESQRLGSGMALSWRLLDQRWRERLGQRRHGSNSEAMKAWWAEHPRAKKPHRPRVSMSRERQAQRSREWWNRHPEERERRSAAAKESYARAMATFREKYPWRQPLFDALRESHPDREPCDQCGEPGNMMLRYDDEAQTVALLGWRCYPCRKAVGRAWTGTGREATA